jgi:excisionase family DNA binding protein
MRSIDDWNKYLDQQEEAVERLAYEPEDPSQPELPSTPSRVVPESTTRAFGANAGERVVPSNSGIRNSQTAVRIASETPATSPVLVRKTVRSAETTKPRVSRTVRKSATTPIHELRTTDDQPRKSEVAQNSYKGFKETREELLRRLLDPEISLEDAARILNVCPTTVRRYTNRGVLQHIRTAGNQRRFRLSDVLSFMESQQKEH